MCGICGIVGASESGAIERMTASLAHRGPDDFGVSHFPDDALALGHRRLAIIDLSPRGHQPMTTRCGVESLWISFNGEIYNYRELRSQLDPARHRFASETDTEVILHLYEERGVEAFKELNGIFAFALYDRPRARLYLVRDQLGVKPLYYTTEGGRLIFGSEIKSILASGDYAREVDWQAARDFFSYLYVPAPATIFRGVHQLEPAHYLEYDLRARSIIRLDRYWDVASWGKNGGKRARRRASPVERQEELRALMADAVRRQMISDVPLGAFLSGGIDSNIIVGLMAGATSRRVETFTVIFDERELTYYDEREEARRVASRFNTSHHELKIDLSRPDEMLDLVEYFDQPFGNATLYLTYLLARETRKQVTVALSGAGGDELFGGYPRYRAVQWAKYLRLIPNVLARGARAALDHLRDDFRDRRLHRARALLGGLDRDPARQYLKWVYYLDEERKDRLLRSRGEAARPAERVLRRHLARYPREWDEGNRFSYLDVETFLVDNLLEYSDKMSMASALELRVPFLDPRLVEFAFDLPFDLKLRGGESKLLLRRAFAELIPAENLRAPKKGFNVPLGAWMRTKLDHYFDERLPRDEVRREGIFDYDYLTALRAEHRAGRRDNAYELFAVLIFDAWYRKYMTGRLPMRFSAGGSLAPASTAAR